MIKYIIKQLLFVVSTFVGLSIITFGLLVLAPDDAETVNLSVTDTSTPSVQSANRNIIQQYINYFSNILKGDFGSSTVSQTPVIDEFLYHLPASIELVVLATIVAFIIGIPLGVFAAIKQHRNRNIDNIINHISTIAYSMPVFWWGLLLIMFFSLNLGITPVAGRISHLFNIEPVTGFMLIDTLISDEPNNIAAFKDALMHLMLPVFVLATLPSAAIIRITRQTMLVALSKDYILTAQAKGLSKFRIYWIHGLRNALIPLVEMLGLQVSTLMSGAMLTEYIFSWPGIGKWLIDALAKGDFETLQGGILVTTTMVILINSVVELLQTWINPKLRNQSRIISG